MGLTMLAYGKLQKVEGCSEQADCGHVRVRAAWGFSARLGSLKRGHYLGNVLERSNQSCTTYGMWRNDLCFALYGFGAKELWDMPLRKQQKYPLYELINYSDFEGTIGPEATKRIAQALDASLDELAMDKEFVGMWKQPLGTHDRMHDRIVLVFRKAAAAGGVVNYG